MTEHAINGPKNDNSCKMKHPSVRPPVVSDAVEEAVSMVNHRCHGTQNCGVAHQAGRQHKVTPTTTADTQIAHKSSESPITLLSSVTETKSGLDYCYPEIQEEEEDQSSESFPHTTSLHRGDLRRVLESDVLPLWRSDIGREGACQSLHRQMSRQNRKYSETILPLG